MTIRSEMPLLAKHEGEWVGEYLTVDKDGKIIDRHRSHLSCKFDHPEHAYSQTNRYMWDDGKQETHFFPATYSNKRIWFDTDRILGSAWEADENTVLLQWERKDLPGMRLFEMIQLSPNGENRTRTWHWFQDNELLKRTLIQESRMS